MSKGYILKQEIKSELVGGVQVYTAMPYVFLGELLQNFFNMMKCYMHSIADKHWHEKLQDELFEKFRFDYKPKVETLDRIRDFQLDRNPAKILNRRFLNTDRKSTRLNSSHSSVSRMPSSA